MPGGRVASETNHRSDERQNRFTELLYIPKCPYTTQELTAWRGNGSTERWPQVCVWTCGRLSEWPGEQKPGVRGSSEMPLE